MEISATAIDWIRREEGFFARPSRNLVGQLAIGHGHTYGVHADTRAVTEAEADALLRADLIESYGPAVDARGLHLNQNQFDAVCSFVYQMGVGVLSPSGTFGSYVQVSDWNGAANALLLYDTVDQHVVPALTIRRTMERALLLAPVAPVPGRLDVLNRMERQAVDSYQRELGDPKRDATSLAQRRDQLGVLRRHVWLAAVRGQEPDGTSTASGWGLEQRAQRYEVLADLSGWDAAIPGKAREVTDA